MSFLYRHKYTNSWALVIGINKYIAVNPLGYACNDANAVANVLKTTYGFPEGNVTVLLDENATKLNIMKEFLKFANDHIQVDDRIVIFYAGHGHTITGRRGEVGYLIPHDGVENDLSSFIRWDELTRNSELIRAKHILYIMDACYSGLAITRSLQPGNVRFLKDMLKRQSRQVLTAGKDNQVVADANGPIPGHSIFTGYLLEALGGKAAKTDDIITANGVMSYVYEKVSNDTYSEQTPHFGFLEGDGDFIFKAPLLETLEDEKAVGVDYLIEVPAAFLDRNEVSYDELLEETKEYLIEDKFRIRLDDLVNRELRKLISLLSDEHFPNVHTINSEIFTERIRKYEQCFERLRGVTICIAHWGNNNHAMVIKRILTKLVESTGGSGFWADIKWYPVHLTMYVGGIAAIANENYDILARILTLKVKEEYQENKELVLVTTRTNLSEGFKLFSEHERHYVPKSEYLYKYLQPELDNLLFLGKSYEDLYDRFEIMYFLVHADLYSDERAWGPVGRFAWKYSRSTRSTFLEILHEAESLKDEWKPLKAGLFNSSYERFKSKALECREMLNRLGWY